VVFFAVGLSKNLTVAYDKHVLFDKVFVDYRGAYNVTSGQFIAPVTGYYEFNLHALEEKGTYLYLRLIHNGTYVSHYLQLKSTNVKIKQSVNLRLYRL